jgi:Transposase
VIPLNALVLGLSPFLRETNMRKSRFTEEPVIKVLNEHAAGLSAADVCRKHGISDATFYIYGLLARGKKIRNLV